MTLEKDLNLEARRETDFMNLLFMSIPPESNPATHFQCSLDNLVETGRYESKTDLVNQYTTWLEHHRKGYRHRD